MDDQGGKQELSGADADMAADNTKQNRDSQLTSGAVRTPSMALSFEVLFQKEIHQLAQRFSSSSDVAVTAREMAPDICKILNAERVDYYRINPVEKSLVTQLTLANGSTPDLKIPITSRSVPGYVVRSKGAVNLTNVYDDAELKAISQDLHFLKAIDTRTGLRTRELMAVPVVANDELFGVLQVVNNKSEKAFTALELQGAEMLAKAIGEQALQLRSGGDAPIKSSIAEITTVISALTPLSRPATKYAELVKNKVVSEADIAKIRTSSGSKDANFENELIRQFRVTPAQIGQALSSFYDVPYEPYQSRRNRVDALHSTLRSDMALRQGWVALSEEPDNGLAVLCLDPDALKSGRLIAQTYPKYTKVTYRVTTHKEFKDTVEQLAVNGIGSIDQLLAQLTKNTEETQRPEVVANQEVEENEVVRIVNKIITDAYQSRASDIHIEPGIGAAKMLVRLRIDGALEKFLELPASLRQAMISRIKVMAELDISESRRPQDGKITFRKFGPLDIELRVATIPSSGGIEDVVMRILAGGEPIPLDDLGLLERNKERLLSVISKPYGLFYVCGPTGSGKTTTLHSILAHLNTPEAKIWTAEDPVEITQRGLRQVQVNKKAGVDFALLMRAFLRADPDIIMVGESRDLETVSMGVEASLTGHMVLSTLHTNSAPEAITRLLDMGMDPFNFADALLGILAQRLARRLCSCKEAYKPSKDEMRAFMTEYAAELRQTEPWQKDPDGELQRSYDQLKTQYAIQGNWQLYKPVGCPECRNTGYRGRVGLHELLLVDDTIKTLIHEKARVALIFTAAIEAGMITLKMDGMQKVLAGHTDMKQVRAVCIK